MESQPRGSDWRSILLLIFSLGGTVLFVSAAIGSLVLATVDESAFPEPAASPMAIILTASTMIAIGLLLLPVAWLSLAGSYLIKSGVGSGSFDERFL